MSTQEPDFRKMAEELYVQNPGAYIGDATVRVAVAHNETALRKAYQQGEEAMRELVAIRLRGWRERDVPEAVSNAVWRIAGAVIQQYWVDEVRALPTTEPKP
jgi:hypothetical protein